MTTVLIEETMTRESTMERFAPRTRFLSIDGGHIAYDDTGGSGPLVIAIPGMGDLRTQYRRLQPALLKSGYRVVTMDIRGHGESSAFWDDYSARAVGQDALRLIEHLGCSAAFLMGNSFAAGSVLWASVDSPAQVLGTVLLGPVVRDGQPSLIAKLALRAGFAGPWRLWFWMTYWNSLFPLGKPADHAAAKEALSRNLREPARMAALRTMIQLSKRETETMLASCITPALVVMGSKDPDFPDATAEAQWLANRIGARPLVIEGAGHYPHCEVPHLVSSDIIGFLREVACRDPGKLRVGRPPASCPSSA